MRVAIAGSSGLIGAALARTLESDGHDVLRLKRGDPGDLAAQWDPALGWMRSGALQGVSAVVNLAGESIGEGRWTARRKEQLRASRIESTRLLVSHLQDMVERPALVNASAVGFYGDRGNEVLDESSGPGSGFLAELTREWEAEAQRARPLDVPVSVLRFGVVLSPDGGALPRMMLPFRFGAGGRLGSGNQWFSWVTLDDALGAIVHAMRNRLDGTYNVTAPMPVTNRELTAALSETMRRPALLPAPGFALKALMGESAGELLLASQRVLPRNLVSTGFEFRRPEVSDALFAMLKGERDAAAPLPGPAVPPHLS